MTASRVHRLVSTALLSLTALAVSGCGAVFGNGFRSVSMAPSGLPWGEEYVRRSLVMGTYDQALERTVKGKDGAPDDEILRALFRGQVAYYAGRWGESAEAFAEADRLTEARYTKSASRGVVSLLTNDNVLRYSPPRTERLFAHYYAMLGRVQSGDVEGAAVDARRLSALLEGSMHDLQAEERPTHAALRDVAGAVFEAAGEWNDASVAYRNAALLRGASRASVDSMVVMRPLGDSATLLLVVESGFVAHYVESALAIPMDDATSSRASGKRRTSPLPIGHHPGTRAADAPSFEPLPDNGKAARSAEARRAVARAASGGVGETPRTFPSVIDAPAVDSVLAEQARQQLTNDVLLQRKMAESVAEIAATVESKSSLASFIGTPQSRFSKALDALPFGGVFVADGAVLGHEAHSDLRAVAASDVVASALVATGPLVEPMTVASDWTPRRTTRTRFLGDRSWNRSWLEIAWPALVRPRLPSAPVTLDVHGLMVARDSASDAERRWEQRTLVPASGVATADITDAVAADAQRLRGARLARLIARTATRVALVEGMREKHGEAAGALASFFVSALERADTRAWHLLPGRLSVVRMTVPAGEINPSLVVGGGGNGVQVTIAPRHAAPGSVHVLPARVWRDPAGGMAPALVAQKVDGTIPIP